jgi:hypothetical protein
MRGICFKEEMFDAVIHGRKTVTRRMNRRYNKGEILYLKEPYIIEDGFVFYKYSSVYLCDKRWKNKLFMPERYARYHIEIVDMRQEHLQDITEEECLKEGIRIGSCGNDVQGWMSAYYIPGNNQPYMNPKIAFAMLIDEIDGNGTWNSNPVVTRYEFKLI